MKTGAKLILITLIFTGCLDIEDIPYQPTEEIVVVEGWLSDSLQPQYVRLSHSVAFSAEQKARPIETAAVALHSNIRVYPYKHAGNGLYLSEDSLRGMVGTDYFIEIQLENGEIIRSSPERMPDVTPIDSLNFDFFTRPDPNDPQEDLTIFYPIAYFDDPAEQNNFYRWKIYRNDTLFSEPEEIFLFSDRFVNGNDSIAQEFTRYEFVINDVARVEIQEISSEAFQFLEELKSQTTTIGTNSAVSPAAIHGNCSYLTNNNPVLGYFGVVSSKFSEKIVK